MCGMYLFDKIYPVHVYIYILKVTDIRGIYIGTYIERTDAHSLRNSLKNIRNCAVVNLIIMMCCHVLDITISVLFAVVMLDAVKMRKYI